ncbi:hypothetical protein C9374_010178 [Naegleria lovaniensis]|uniref:ER membrane protein complex subunit 7 beta-sandwich domain-containing protein n=1 Tax=Naegleria lovaniensis TaxID=51637 RepID=A0AA88GH42_NAELO|nr:uncharacterized protein C9374_010178 [Naegleria lovaniensis]KAG2375174.1 hypothetical protein C9374_010178 [Naegleria lovaniensis]
MKSFIFYVFVLVLMMTLVSESFQQSSSETTTTITATLLGQVVDIPKNMKKDDQQDPIKILLLRQDSPSREDVYFVRADGSFAIEGLTPGSHILQLVCHRFEFAKIRIDVSKSGKMRGVMMIPSNHPSLLTEEERKSGAAQSLDGFGFVKQGIQVEPVLRVKPLTVLNYFEVVPGFDYFGILKNPMVIMLVVGVLISVVFPKLIDPEAMKEAQKSMSQSESEFKNLLGGLNTQISNQAASPSSSSKKKSKSE